MVEPYCPESGDFVWVDFNPQVGHEQAGFRPALVVSPRIFNWRTSLAYICPITTKAKDYPFEVTLPANLPIRGVVLCEHLRSMDWRGRSFRFAGRAPGEVLGEVRDMIASIAGIAP